MLILGRREGDVTRIVLPDGTTVRVVVVKIDRHKMRLGIDAPQSVKVWREEVWERMQADAAPIQTIYGAIEAEQP